MNAQNYFHPVIMPTERAIQGQIEESRTMRQVTENIWVMRFPHAVLGAQLGRTVTLIRLATGRVLIHSTAPFTEEDVARIHSLGRPSWLVEATRFHDTFASLGRAAFPSVPYLVPPGFPAVADVTQALRPEPRAWLEELEVLELRGMPQVREHVFFHRPTRTLIVADLMFNFGPQSSAWTRWFFRWLGGIQQFPGMSWLFRACIRDRAAFSNSVEEMMSWDFDRLIVGHGDVIETGAKPKLAAALADRGF